MNSRNALRAGVAGATLVLTVLGLLWLVSVRQRQSTSPRMAKEETLIGASGPEARAAAVNGSLSGGHVSPVAAMPVPAVPAALAAAAQGTRWSLRDDAEPRSHRFN